MLPRKWVDAMRENRQGRVRVAACFEGHNELALAPVRAAMMIIQIERDEFSECSEWRGYSPAFDALPLGAAAPLYAATISSGGDGAVSVEFSRCV